MTKLPTLLIALLIPLAACKKKDAEAPPAPPTGSAPAGSGSAAAPAGSGSAAGSAAAAPAKPPTGDELAKRYVECWGFFSAHDMDKLKTCYTANATSVFVDSGIPDGTGADDIVAKHSKPLVDAFPDIKGDVELTLINGMNGVTVALVTGTNDGTMKTPMGDVPATKKKIGLQVAHAVHFADGKAADKEAFYQDLGEQMSQLGLSKAPARKAADKAWGPNEVVIAKDDDGEKKNLAAVGAMNDAFNKHDGKAIEGMLADDLQWSEQGLPKDWNKKEAVAAHGELFKGFSDIKIATDTVWAAGDYVVAQGTMSGTNDGPAPSMGLKAKTGKPVSVKFLQVFKLKDGKITRSLGFWNSMAMAQQLGMIPPAGAGDKKPADEKKPADDKKPADKKPADKPKK
jgi:ketosteroid isomerase-like protein